MAHQKISANDVANYFLLKGQEEGKTITNKKLQKLLYYAQAWSLAALDKKLFDEKIEAWVHGPAIRTIYLENKKYGFGPIGRKINVKDIPKMSSDVKGLLDEIWSIYGKFDASYLEKLTHSESPWIDARAGLEANINSENEITLDSMRSYYSSVLHKSSAEKAAK